MRSGGGYQYPQGTTTTTYNTHYGTSQSSYSDGRSPNPMSPTQYYPQSYSGSKTTDVYHSTPIRRVNPALTINPNQLPKSSQPNYSKPNSYYRKNPHAEIDDSPIIDPSAFRYLNLGEPKVVNKKSIGCNEMDSGIDSIDR